MPFLRLVKETLTNDSEYGHLFSKDDPERIFIDLREIGHGNFGAVYYARNSITNEIVAIKKMSIGRKQNAETWQDILKEIRFLSELNHHHCISYRGCYFKDNTTWLVMDYCLGSAADLIEVHKKPLNEGEIATIMHDTLSALAYLHSIQRIHRDIKAGNILLTEDAIVKLADFGSASFTCPANSFIGTPYWIAPEVILAMETGQYNGKVDIWSLGITCIELAERKPPLFNMNPMSALYHIAQNEPPKLMMKNNNEQTTISYTNDFVAFIDLCLQKNPNNRPTSNELRDTSFIKNHSNREILIDLIRRTKEAVKEFDDIHYRRMKKVLMEHEEENNSMNANTNQSSNDLINSDILYKIRIDDGTINDDNYDAQNVDFLPRTNEKYTNDDDDESLNSSRSSLQQVPSTVFKGLVLTKQLATTSQPVNNPIYTGMPSNIDNMNQQLPVVDTVSISHVNHVPTNTNKSDVQMKNNSKFSNPAPNRSVAYEFSTIKTSRGIIREQREHDQDDQQFEQFRGYKQMRHQHQKQLKQFEERCCHEKLELRSKLEREYDGFQDQINVENARLLDKHRKDLAERVKYNQNNIKNLERQQEIDYENELKHFHQEQTKQYKLKKDDLKKKISNSTTRSKYEKQDEIRQLKGDLQLKFINSEENLKTHLIRNFTIKRFQSKRTNLLLLHSLEKKLFEEKSTKNMDIIVQRHGLLRKHHEQTKDLELKQLTNLHKMRNDFTHKQHQTEIINFNEYGNRRQKELTKRHALNQKQLPKNIKNKQVEIKRQHKDAYNLETRQYKLLKEKLRLEYIHATTNQLREQIDIKLKSIKDEQRRKLDLLYLRYEEDVQKMFAHQNIKLNTEQQRERNLLKAELDEDYRNLISLQEQSYRRMEQQHLDEKRQLDRNIEDRLNKFNEQMKIDLHEYNENYTRELSHVLDKQQRELTQLDNEITKSDINTNDLIESM